MHKPLRDAANVISPSAEPELLLSRRKADEIEFLDDAFMWPSSDTAELWGNAAGGWFCSEFVRRSSPPVP